ncbi:hypothetical protein [Pseudoalteromonas arctica]|uniref:Uncharacterized protein n=1 Tax=Pseudoalteromonas arctica TaxID=394751 RepID=A0A7Y0DTX4_9GAMM|nr:hypothetical protein [Pseudoalteromonas arctica]NMM41500.1 hypothetical protein [Pseudoalteromonas arctica]
MYFDLFYPAPILFVDEAGLLQQGSLASLNAQQHHDFVHDAFNYQKVPSLKTVVVADQSDETITQLEEYVSL